jgi:hypothetical protein
MVKKATIDKWVGKKFGRFTITKFIEKHHNMYKFEYICECGFSKIAQLSAIKSKKICLNCCIGAKHPEWRGYGEISKNIYTRLERNAKERHLDFNVTIEYLWGLFLAQNRKCALTDLNLEFQAKYADVSKTTASLDRIDSSKGYIEGNVQWVHKFVNHIKSNIPNQYFILLANLISKKHTSTLKESDFYNSELIYMKLTKGIKHSTKYCKYTYSLINKQGTEKKTPMLVKFCKNNGINYGNLMNNFRNKNEGFTNNWKIIEKIDKKEYKKQTN